MMHEPTVIATDCLRLEQVPAAKDPWHLICRFALTFDPREMGEYAESASDLNNVHEGSSLVALRAHLYVEQRRWNHYCRDPDAHSELQVRQIIRLLRLRLASRI